MFAKIIGSFSKKSHDCLGNPLQSLINITQSKSSI
jgi:hypothetical protein